MALLTLNAFDLSVRGVDLGLQGALSCEAVLHGRGIEERLGTANLDGVLRRQGFDLGGCFLEAIVVGSA